MITTKVNIDDTSLLRTLSNMAKRTQDLTPAMKEAAGIMQEASDLAFRGQYDPVTGAKWPALNPQYAAQRAEQGHAGKMLQISGGREGLKGSISRDYGRNFARLGSNHVFAAVHQFGAKTRPHTITAKKGKALRIPGIGYRKSVRHPGSAIPQRRFLGLDGGDIRAMREALWAHIKNGL